jgi:hypothetical protein
MTLPPEQIGDKGQRYEVTYFDTDAGKRRTFGWTSTLAGARSLAQAIDLHPTMDEPMIMDRRPGP